MRRTHFSSSFRLSVILTAIVLSTATALAQSRNQESLYMLVSTSHGVIAGDSKDPAHPEWITLENFQYRSISTPEPGKTGSAAAARAGMSHHKTEIVVTKAIDKSSASLHRAEASGEHFPQAVIEICKGGVCKQRVRLKDVWVSSCQTAEHGNFGIPTETVTFEALRIERE
jgi:type VI protein secretion system component Hcp